MIARMKISLQKDSCRDLRELKRDVVMEPMKCSRSFLSLSLSLATEIERHDFYSMIPKPVIPNVGCSILPSRSKNLECEGTSHTQTRSSMMKAQLSAYGYTGRLVGNRC